VSRLPSIHIAVETKGANGEIINEVGGEPASWDRTIVSHKDKFKQLLGDGGARVSMTLNERMGGSHGYSGVSTSVTVTLTCNQSEKTIRQAADLAFEECVAITGDVFPKAKSVLEGLLREHYEVV
jgi:hypothetical protein